MRSNEEKETFAANFAHNSGEKAPEGDMWEEILEFVRVYSKNGELLIEKPAIAGRPVLTGLTQEFSANS